MSSDFGGRFGRRVLLGSLGLVVALGLGSCFDYRETLYIRADFSGYVDIDYNVPVYRDRDRSMVGFLPISQKRITRRYLREIYDFKVEIMNVAAEAPFSRRARVSFRVYFTKASELERILMGRTRGRFDSTRRVLRVERIFPTGRSNMSRADRLERRLDTRIMRMLAGHSLILRVRHAEELRVESDEGEVVGEHMIRYELPLVETMNRERDLSWNLVVRERRRPREPGEPENKSESEKPGEPGADANASNPK